MSVRAVIFDISGTVLDFGSRGPAVAFVELFARHGVAVTEAEARAPMGKHKRDHIQAMLSDPAIAGRWADVYGSPASESDIDRLYGEFTPLLVEILERHSDVLPGVPELVRQLRARNIKIANTTGFESSMIGGLKRRAAEGGYEPDLWVTPDLVGKGRPAPWMAFHAARQLDVYPMSDFVKVGDTLADIDEAHAAGMWAVGVLRHGNEIGLSREAWDALPSPERDERLAVARARLAGRGAHYVIESTPDLLPVIDEIDARLARGERPYAPYSPDKLLFTPGPLSTTPSVKQAMLRDLGSRDAEFIDAVREIRARLLAIGGVASPAYEVVPMQGSGTFAVEAAIGSMVPPQGRLLACVNGAYGRRLAHIAQRLAIDTVVLQFGETEPVDPAAVAAALASEGPFTHTAVIHCETTSGILNPIAEIGAAAADARAVFVVDAMSTFGGIPFHVTDTGIDCLISSANKCIQGVPGFAFVLIRREQLRACEGRARSVSLDLHAQWAGLEADGQFRFTPPIQALLAFREALRELEEEGGVTARHARYCANHAALMEEMLAMKFVPFVPAEFRSPIITAFRYPDRPGFRFGRFYDDLLARGFIISPGKLSHEEGFRIGTIGNLAPSDVHRLTAAIREALAQLPA